MTETEMREAIDAELDRAADRFMAGDTAVSRPAARQIAVTYAVDAYARGFEDGSAESACVDPTFVDTYCRLVIELLANKNQEAGMPGEDTVEIANLTARRIIESAVAFGRGL